LLDEYHFDLQNVSKIQKIQTILTNILHNRRPGAFLIALIPFIVLLSNTGNDNIQRLFRAYPYNISYELMTCAVGSAVLITAFLENGLVQNQIKAIVPARELTSIALSPFMIFMGMWSIIQLILNAVNGTIVTSILWGISAVVSIIKLVHEFHHIPQNKSLWIFSIFSNIDRSCMAYAIRIILVIFAIGLWIPILLPWEGPPEPFVRWHTFSLQGELLWRGTFACFSLCNILTALDPTGAGAGYTAFMAAQGIFHGTVMLIDNRISASNHGSNGNAEHAWGEIPFFLILGLSLSILLITRFRPESKQSTIMIETVPDEIVLESSSTSEKV